MTVAVLLGHVAPAGGTATRAAVAIIQGVVRHAAVLRDPVTVQDVFEQLTASHRTVAASKAPEINRYHGAGRSRVVMSGRSPVILATQGTPQ
eukprot:14733119-Heterocapsa_arctica.AAC.1